MIKIQRFRSYDLVAIVVCVLLVFTLCISQPRLSRSTYKAFQSNCACNMKQLGNAGALYEGYNAGVRPGPQPLGENLLVVAWDRPLAIQMGARLGLAKVYEPVVNLTSVPSHTAFKTLVTFICPADTQAKGARIVPAIPGSFADGTADGTGICRSYVLDLGSGNLVAGKDDGIAATAAAIRLAKIESAAGTVNLIESHGYATVFGQRNIANDTTIVCTKIGGVVPADAFTNPLARMHGVKSYPRVNALFYDGHVEIIEQSSIIADGGQVMQYIKGDEPLASTTQAGGPAK
jgi:prepilin-type processing-associated H-X9-DG protein